MSAIKLVFAFARRKPLTWAFHVLTLALGVGVVVSVMLLSAALDRRFERDLAGVDLVVGAKGSPLQLIMSALFAIDIPNGNIPSSVAERISRHPLVAQAIPVSLGDNVEGVRIVGTTPDYGALYDARMAHGAWWREPMEVVLGADAARRLNKGVGDRFVGQHGLVGGEAHADLPYLVVGVLRPTGAVIDRLALTATESVWRVHEQEHTEESADAHELEEREVTALLIRYKSTMGAVMLPRFVRAMPDIQAAAPALEAARLNTLLGAGASVLRWLGFGLLALSALGFLVALIGSVQQRQRELALLRVLGGGPMLLLSVVLIEALFLGLLGGALGAGLGRVAALVAATASAAHGGPALNLAPFGALDAAALGAAGALSLAAALAPSVFASRIDPAQTLKTG